MDLLCFNIIMQAKPFELEGLHHKCFMKILRIGLRKSQEDFSLRNS